MTKTYTLPANIFSHDFIEILLKEMSFSLEEDFVYFSRSVEEYQEEIIFDILKNRWIFKEHLIYPNKEQITKTYFYNLRELLTHLVIQIVKYPEDHQIKNLFSLWVKQWEVEAITRKEIKFKRGDYYFYFPLFFENSKVLLKPVEVRDYTYLKMYNTYWHGTTEEVYKEIPFIEIKEDSFNTF